MRTAQIAHEAQKVPYEGQKVRDGGTEETDGYTVPERHKCNSVG